MYKLVAVDLDGTLLTSSRQLSDETIDAVKYAKSKGVKIVLCTGRPLIGIKDLLKKLNLEDPGDYAITFNGALIQDISKNEAIYHVFLDKNDIKNIYIFSLLNNLHMHFYDTNTLYTPNTNISKWTISEAFNCNIPIQYTNIEDIGENFFCSKAMIIDDPEKLDINENKIKSNFGDNYTVIRSSPHFYEILNKQTDKAQGLNKLANYLNLKQEEIIAIGDHENDLSMIKYAGLGVAMGNALDSVKEIADEITLSNDENGVAYIIKKYI